jgi:hypothetical protein
MSGTAGLVTQISGNCSLLTEQVGAVSRVKSIREREIAGALLKGPVSPTPISSDPRQMQVTAVYY